MTFLAKLTAPKDTGPKTVDEAISNLSTSLEVLAQVSVERRAEAANKHDVADALKAAAVAAEAEADRADRVYENISALLK